MNKICIVLVISTLLAIPLIHGHEQNKTSQEQFLMSKLQEIVESKKPITVDINWDGIKITNHDSQNSKQKAISTMPYLAGVVSACTMMLKCNIVNPPADFWDFIKKSFYFSLSAVIGGSVLSLVYKPAVEVIVTLFYNLFINESSNLNRDVLTEFIGRWNEFKPNIPISLHETFDTLYTQYMNNGGKLTINEQEANQLITNILLYCIKGHSNKVEAVAL